MAISRLFVALVAAMSLVAAGCGSDDDPAESTTTAAPEATEEFCDAWGDYENAQDGAQLNTALGVLGEELPADAPDDVVAALETMGAGDLDPQEVVDAAATFGAYVVEECGPTTSEEVAVEVSAALCDAWQDYQNAEDGAQLNTALGIVTTELPPGAPDDVVAAVVVLSTGDVDPADTAAASETVQNWVDDNCS